MFNFTSEEYFFHFIAGIFFYKITTRLCENIALYTKPSEKERVAQLFVPTNHSLMSSFDTLAPI